MTIGQWAYRGHVPFSRRSRWRRRVIVGLALFLVAGCGRHPAHDQTAPPSTASSSAAGSVPVSPSPAAPPAFVGNSATVTAADVPYTWHEGCPVGPTQLSLLHLSYWGFDDQPHIGTMVVSRAVTADVIKI